MIQRIIRKIKRIRDLETNRIDELGSENELHRLLEEGNGLESIYVDEKVGNICGCLGPSSGRCGRCGKPSCQRCHTHCGGTDNPSPLGCGIPICRNCSENATIRDGSTLRLCSSCYSKFSRKKLWGTVTKLLAEPGIEFEDTDG